MNIDELLPEIQPPNGGWIRLRARLNREAGPRARPGRRLVFGATAVVLVMVLIFVPWKRHRVTYEDLLAGEPGALVFLGMAKPEGEPVVLRGDVGRLMPIRRSDKVLFYQHMGVPPLQRNGED
jgi:hypothetical protein